MLTALGAEVKEIRQLRDFEDSFDGIVIPGGESTVMGKLLRELGLLSLWLNISQRAVTVSALAQDLSCFPKRYQMTTGAILARCP